MDWRRETEGRSGLRGAGEDARVVGGSPARARSCSRDCSAALDLRGGKRDPSGRPRRGRIGAVNVIGESSGSGDMGIEDHSVRGVGGVDTEVERLFPPVCIWDEEDICETLGGRWGAESRMGQRWTRRRNP